MIVLKSTTETQTFDFIPREYVPSLDPIYKVSIFSEIQNKEIYSQTTSTFDSISYYNSYSDVFTLIEDQFYMLTIEKNNEVIFLDKIFCTNKATGNYWTKPLTNWTDENTKTNETDNEFIVI